MPHEVGTALKHVVPSPKMRPNVSQFFRKAERQHNMYGAMRVRLCDFVHGQATILFGKGKRCVSYVQGTQLSHQTFNGNSIHVVQLLAPIQLPLCLNKYETVDVCGMAIPNTSTLLPLCNVLDSLKYLSNSVSCLAPPQWQAIFDLLKAEFCADSMKV